MNLNWKELLAVEYCSTWGAIAWEAWPHADTHSLSTGAGLIALRGPDGTIAIHRRWFSGGILRTWPQSLRSDIGILIEEAGAVPQDSAIAECRVRVERRQPNDSEALLGVAEIPIQRRASEAEGIRWIVTPTEGPEGEFAHALGILVSVAADPDARGARLVEGEVVRLSTPDLAHPMLWPSDEQPVVGMGSLHALAEGRLLRLLEGEPLWDAEGDEVRAERYWVHDPQAPYGAPGTVLRTQEDVLWWRAGMQPELDAPLPSRALDPVETLLRSTLLTSDPRSGA
ncbi:hypothetical protein Bequi_08985 [Brachybacterium sp. JHP9]|uniref:Uncharacterized protein n=1 Tax=Brachybacterium equifaecis TaxID=2910770 RepID=A0ABT0R0V2_9MICO|nr:hypothetical protein [Brachybacterium equifaecis]MCL6423516.1 hypothetical protein [Brachybacterium equifaecis]